MDPDLTWMRACTSMHMHMHKSCGCKSLHVTRVQFKYINLLMLAESGLIITVRLLLFHTGLNILM